MVAALYRRYRPEAFSEMIGQSQVTEPLMTALRTGRVGHAYLFSGPRGCGKTTSARILARCLNCAEGPTDTPCGSCDSCVELSRSGGGSLDVVEIDAASHGGVDDARDLRERAAFAPARDRFKIFIIDEAHMVTAGGFNALLKIVEEPPPHVKFIFATTEPEKVIGTIRSRTHHYPFRLIAPGTLIEYVQQLSDSEGVQVEPGVLPLVVRAGGGSVRDTLSILDQLIAGSEGGSVSASRAAGLLGFTSSELLDEVVVALAAGDAGAAFTATDRVIQTGQDPRRFVEDLLERLRDLIVVGATSVDGAAAVFRGVPQDQLERMFEQSRAFGRGELSRIADIVSATLDSMTGATAPRLQLELMIARALAAWPGQPVVAPPREGGAAAPAADSAPPAPAAPAPPAEQPAARPVAEPVAEPAAAPPAEQEEAPNAAQTASAIRDFLREDDAGAHPNAAPASFGRPISDVLSSDQIEGIGADSAFQAPPESPAPPAAPETPEGGSLEDLLVLWPEVLEEIHENDEAAWNAVRAVAPLALEGEVLTIGIPTKADLEAFKSAGANPLREAILAATGVTVKYVPRQISTAPREDATPQQSEPEPEEPHRGAEDDAVARAEAKLSAFGPALAAPAWAEEAPEEPESEAREPEQPEPRDPDPGPEVEVAEYGPESEPSEPAGSAQAPSEGDAPSPEKSAPAFTRYGEAVVREVLGARFVEERPLPPGE